MDLVDGRHTIGLGMWKGWDVEGMRRRDSWRMDVVDGRHTIELGMWKDSGRLGASGLPLANVRIARNRQMKINVSK